MTARTPLPAAAALVAVLSAAPLPDLEVGIPPGAPQEWSHAFPAITPRSGGGPETGREKAVAPGRTVSRPRRVDVEVPLTSSWGLLRILTRDLQAHVGWTLQPGPTVTGDPGAIGFRPLPGEALYWVGLAPLLRHLLHPAMVSGVEVEAHLVEIGTPVAPVLDAAETEPALRDLAADLRARLAFDVEPPTRRDWRDERWAMLGRFAREELLAAHPYDPEGAFGRRLFLIPESVEPVIAVYLDDAQAPLRRAAAAALARYRTPTAMAALANAAATTTDDVVLARACAAIGRYRSLARPEPLIARLAASEDDLETALLIEALGRTRRDDVVAALVSATEHARRERGDVLVTALGALAQLWKPKDPERVLTVVGRVESDMRARPEAYQVLPKGPLPDRPDGPKARRRLLEQLARIVRARLTPDPGRGAGKRARGALLALVGKDPERQVRGYAGGWADRSLERVHPRARLVFLDALAEAGADGAELLTRLAADTGLDPVLRGAALGRLGWSRRSELTAAFVENGSTPTTLRIHAFEILAADGHSKLDELARATLAGAAETRPESLLPAEQHLTLVALRALSRRGKLATADVARLLPHVRFQRAVRGALPRRVLDHVEQLVAAVAARAQHVELERRARELVELLLAAGIRPDLTEEDVPRLERRVLALAEGARGHDRNEAHKRRVSDAIVGELLGRDVWVKDRGLGSFEPVVPLQEELLFALARTGPDGVEVLARFLADPSNPHRPAACAALAAAATPEAARVLAGALVDHDRVVRLVSYEALRTLTGEDYFADWFDGDEHDRAVAAERYQEWLRRGR